MQYLIVLLWRALGWVIPQLGFALLRGIGFAAVTYTGVTTVMSFAKDYVFSNLGAVPAAWLQIAGILQIDVAINILFSAYVARAVLWGMNKSGSKSTLNYTGK